MQNHLQSEKKRKGSTQYTFRRLHWWIAKPWFIKKLYENQAKIKSDEIQKIDDLRTELHKMIVYGI